MYRVETLRGNLGDCTNNGVTARTNRFNLMTEEEAMENLDFLGMTKEEIDEVLIIKTKNLGKEVYIYAVPLASLMDEKWYMMGGNFVYTSDSRFREEVNAYPIPVHDRVE